MSIKNQFYIADYVVFATTVVISISIGIYYAMSGGRQRTTAEYLMGGRAMSFLPVAISLMVSFESSIMMLGIPAESYVYGMQYIMSSAGFLVSQIISIRVLVPLLHPLKITSVYEYLEYRFNSRAVRLLGMAMGAFTYTWYMGIVLFGPAVALEAVTGFPQWMSIFTVCGVAVIYTSIGGLKAVIWTDVFQCFIMFAGIFAILIKGTIDTGGAKEVWETASRGGRLNFFNFETDPTVRHTFWTLFVGSVIRGMGMCFNQSTVQRLNSTKELREAKRILIVVAPCFFVSITLALIEGTVAYSYYEKKQCDPFASDQLNNPNQIIPYMVMDIFANMPGMPGLFLASLFSASLSTLSTGLSSLSALVWADVVHPLVGDISEVKATLIAKISVIVFGLIACGIAMLVSLIGGTLIQIAATLLSAFGGPLSGIFLLGCFFPKANAKGTMIGGVVSFLFCTWISLGMNFSPGRKKTPWLPAASTDQCDAILNVGNSTIWTSPTSNLTMSYYSTTAIPGLTSMVTDMTSTISSTSTEAPQGLDKLYSISYMWIGVIGILATMIVGWIASIITGANKPGDVDPRYILCVSDFALPFLPKSIRNYISSIGPQFIKPEYKLKFPDPALKAEPLANDVEIPLMHVEALTENGTKLNGDDRGDATGNDLKTAANGGSGSGSGNGSGVAMGVE